MGKRFNYNNKKIYQYSLEGDLISSFKDVYEASKKLNIKKEYIFPVLNGKQQYTNNFYFSFKQIESKKIIKNRKKYKCKPVIQYDLDGKIINGFKDVYEASKIINNKVDKIVENLKGLRKTTNGFVFKWKGEKFDYIKPNLKRYVEQKIIQYDLEGNKINEFKDIYEASKKLNIDISSFLIYMNSGRELNKLKGYIFLYEGENIKERIKIINNLKGISKPELEIYNYIKEIYKGKILKSNKDQISKELDIYIPEKKLAIEFNGLYWHSSAHKDKYYHRDKLKECQNKNIRLIQIFEDEWVYKKDIVKSRLKNILGLTPHKIYARKTIIKEVPTKEAMEFLDENHLQGKVGARVKLGLYYKNNLVTLMTFGKLRRSLGNKDFKEGEYELIRFANKLNTNVMGGASKLLKYFTKNYNPKSVISYADLRWSEGKLYEKLGFEKINITSPSFDYFFKGKRVNRFNFRKSKLIKEGFDSNKSEEKINFERGIYRIYDCGKIKYKLNIYNK